MRRGVLMAGLALVAGLAAAAPAAARGRVGCELRYSLTGWSLVYQSANGAGTVVCDNGVRIPVRIQARGGGLSVGKTRISDGHGRFTAVARADDVLGAYVAAGAHAGAARHAGSAQLLSNGQAGLALAGKGQGWSLGVGLTRLVIERR